MLTRLVIQDVVLIDRLTVPFQSGLNVFTGETGAGKSILLDALALALGARSDASLIRAGAAQASVTAEFICAPSSALAALLDEQGLIIEEPLILRRTIGKDGKSRAFLCDQPIGVTLLRRIGELLLEVHGQFETHGLLNPATHRELLDSFAGTHALLDRVEESFAVWKRAVAALDEAQSLSSRAQAEEEFLRAALDEMEEVAPQEGEVDKLAEQRLNLQNREKIVEALTGAEDTLSGDRGALLALARASKTLVRISDKCKGAQEIVTLLDRASNDAAEASHLLARTMQDIDADSLSLEKIEERLFRLRALARKHGVAPETLHELHADLRLRLDLVTGQGGQMAQLAKAVETSRKDYMKLSQELSAGRQKAASLLAKGVMKELPPLKLERAVFTVDCSPLPENQWSAEGMDRVSFLAATNTGATPAPLQKVASGGELARFMLAIKVVLSKAAPVSTLVFDEVDAGIGGATASAVGERLELLSRDVQVLVVTHSPQIAARGAHHLRVRKQEKGKFPTTLVDALDEQDRVEEIARMLAGAQTTDAARQAALSLLQNAREDEQAKPVKQKKRA